MKFDLGQNRIIYIYHLSTTMHCSPLSRA